MCPLHQGILQRAAKHILHPSIVVVVVLVVVFVVVGLSWRLSWCQCEDMHRICDIDISTMPQQEIHGVRLSHACSKHQRRLVTVLQGYSESVVVIISQLSLFELSCRYFKPVDVILIEL
jgi:hypothetical protein